MCRLSCVIMSFSFLLVFSCLVLSVFSTIPEHQKFANQGLFILVRPLPAHMTTSASIFLPCPFIHSVSLAAAHLYVLALVLTCLPAEAQTAMQAGGRIQVLLTVQEITAMIH